jgi:hypothetical protein
LRHDSWTIHPGLLGLRLSGCSGSRGFPRDAVSTASGVGRPAEVTAATPSTAAAPYSRLAGRQIDNASIGPAVGLSADRPARGHAARSNGGWRHDGVVMRRALVEPHTKARSAHSTPPFSTLSLPLTGRRHGPPSARRRGAAPDRAPCKNWVPEQMHRAPSEAAPSAAVVAGPDAAGARGQRVCRHAGSHDRPATARYRRD